MATKSSQVNEFFYIFYKKERYNYPYCDASVYVMFTPATYLATVVPTKSDSDVKLCLQLLSKTLTCTLHLS